MSVRHSCPVCGVDADVGAAQCDACGVELGYAPGLRCLVGLQPDGAVDYTLSPPAGVALAASSRWWRCLEFAWGCNWIVPAGSADDRCPSCALTRARPTAGASLAAVHRWTIAEAAKRRLVRQLDSLGVPLRPLTAADDGIAFVFLDACGSGRTGYAGGVISVDLREVDDAFRAARRAEFDEPVRTVLGHLRHEIGHHLWRVFVARGGAVDAFRALFGDERTDYAAALAEHHATTATRVPSPTHITAYAASHPSEDWAETVAHYLHLRDGVETVDDLTPSIAPSDDSFGAAVDRWRNATALSNAVAHALGERPTYAVPIGPVVERKLAFVHGQFVRAAVDRARSLGG